MSTIPPLAYRPNKPPPDPRYFMVLLDAHILDGSAPPETERAIELLIGGLRDGGVSVLLPHSVKREIDDPATPPAVKTRASDFLYTEEVQLIPAELALHDRVRAIVRGQALSDTHDADAFHLVEASKYGAYFITLDRRLLRKRDEVRALLPDFWPMTPEELVAVYDERLALEAGRPVCG